MGGILKFLQISALVPFLPQEIDENLVDQARDNQNQLQSVSRVFPWNTKRKMNTIQSNENLTVSTTLTQTIVKVLLLQVQVQVVQVLDEIHTIETFLVEL